MTIFAIFGLAVLGFGNTSTANGTDSESPKPSVTYPVRFDQITSNGARVAVPHPTVSYPIKFDTPTPKKAAPRPSVSYPIVFSTMGGER